MDNNFKKDLNDLAHQFHTQNINAQYSPDIAGFKQWIAEEHNSGQSQTNTQLEWHGREEGRTPESVISTLIVHLNRYARRYSEAAIAGSAFTSQDDFVYLINLKAFGQMTKDTLIRSNFHDESDGMQIISRLESNGWIENAGTISDCLSDAIQISELGEKVLRIHMKQIRKATSMVAGDLSHHERIELIKILTKLELHHQAVFSQCNIKDLIVMIQ